MKMADDTLVQVVGHCGKDADTSLLSSGKPICKVSVAVSWGKDDDRKSCWYDITAWDDQAMLLGQFKKGDAISVIGPRKSREHNDKIYWSITAWEIARPMWKKREAEQKPKQAQGRQEEDDDEDGFSEIPF
jgi:single-stranded DNA-binding protein